MRDPVLQGEAKHSGTLESGLVQLSDISLVKILPQSGLKMPIMVHYVASYRLAALGDDTSPSAKDIKKILDSVGIEADDDRLNEVISELNSKNIEDVIAQGTRKLASMPAGRTVAVSAAPGAAALAAGSAPAAAEEKEESEESDDAMGFGSFD
nr:large ribosomal subunit protein P2-like [Kogia breviceps]